jgi:UDP:flavonoid glycosyltransferase YjiC (YdhE family)
MVTPRRILFAWQLGANYGHLATDLPVAECLRRRGYDVSFVVADMRVAAEILSPPGFSFVPIPERIAPSVSPPPPASYAQIMHACGFGDHRDLSRLLDAWSALITHADVGVLVADHAPMAVLAAHLVDIPTVLIGSGFTIPPMVSPLPSIRPWEIIPSDRLQQVESIVLGNINAVIQRLGRPPFTRLAELFARPKSLLTTFPELDPYGAREDGTYIGPISSESNSKAVKWRSGSQPRIFAYLRPTVPRIAAILTALEESDAQVIVAMPGASNELQQHFESTSITLLSHAVPLTPLLSDADVVVSYGGAGTIAQSLLAGVPMLLVPEHAEQYLSALQVANLGAGVLVGLKQEDKDIARALEQLLENPAYRESARRIAARYQSFNRDDAANTAASIIAQCLP